MADFDPDQYLAQKTGGGGFDPDAYLAQKTGQSGVQGPEPRKDPNLLQKIASSYSALQGGLIKGATFGNLDPNNLPLLGKAYSLGQAEHPDLHTAGQVGGSVGSGALLGAAGGTAAAATGLADGALGRMATNAAVGGAQGVSQKPEGDETRLGNAGKQALLGTGIGAFLEGGSKVLSGAGRLSEILGGKLGGLTKAESAAMAANPKAAEGLAEMNRSDPQGLTRQIQDKLRGVRGSGGREGGALSDVFENVVAPERAKLIQKGVGRNASINRSDFKGTAVEPELDRVAKLENPQSKQIDVPVEPAPPASDPSFIDKNNEVLTGKPDRQVSYTSRPIAPAKETPASSTPFQDQLNKYQPILHESASPETVSYTEKGLPPPPDYKSVQRVNMPLETPDKISVNASQLDRLKRIAQDAAFEESRARGMSPIANKANDALEGAAASRLQAAQRGVVPELQSPSKIRTPRGVEEAPAILDRLEETANYSNHAKGMKPAQLLSTSESAGALPVRSMRQFLDEASNGRAGLENMAQGLSGGKKLTDPSSGALDFLKKQTSRGLFRVPNSTKGAENLMNSPVTRSLFLREIEDDKK